MQKKNCRKPTRFAQPRPGSHSHGPRNQWRPLTFISFDRRFLISLSNGSQVPHSSTGFPSCPGIVNIRKGFLSSTIHYILSTIHHPLDIKHNIPMQGCNSTTPMMLSSLSKVPHPPCSSTLKVRLGPRHQVYPHSAQDQGLSQILTIRLSLSFGWWHNTCP